MDTATRAFPVPEFQRPSRDEEFSLRNSDILGRDQGSYLSIGSVTSSDQMREQDQRLIRSRYDPQLLSLSQDNFQTDELINSAKEVTYVSPRFREAASPEYVSNFVAYGRSVDSDTLSSKTNTRPRHSSFDNSEFGSPAPGELVGQVLALEKQLQEKEDLVSDLKQQQDELILSFQSERDALTRDLEDGKRLTQELQRNVKSLETTNRKLLRELQIKEEEQRTFKQDLHDLQGQISALERTKSALLKEVDESQTKVHDLETLRGKMDQVMSQWKSERSQLLRDLEDAKGISETHRNRDGSKEHGNRDRSKEDRSRRITEMESELKALDAGIRKGDMERSPKVKAPRSKSQGRLKKLVSPGKGKVEEKELLNTPKAPTLATQKKLLRDVMELLVLSSPSELLPEIRSLTRKVKALDSANEFIEKICGKVMDLSPPGTFLQTPTLQQVWRWVKRLIDEYMILRKSRDSSSQSRQALEDMSLLLGAETSSQATMTLESLLKEVNILRDIEAQVRNLLHMDSSKTIREVMLALKEQMHG